MNITIYILLPLLLILELIVCQASQNNTEFRTVTNRRRKDFVTGCDVLKREKRAWRRRRRRRRRRQRCRVRFTRYKCRGRRARHYNYS